MPPYHLISAEYDYSNWWVFVFSNGDDVVRFGEKLGSVHEAVKGAGISPRGWLFYEPEEFFSAMIDLQVPMKNVNRFQIDTRSG